MFKLSEIKGEHKIYNFETFNYNFLEFFQKLYDYDNLENLHLISKDYQESKEYSKLGFFNDRDTDLHKIFYKKIKSDNDFKEIYCNLINDIHNYFFPEEEYLLYQSFPSLRVQFMDSVAIPPHYDSDHIGNHPIGEKNFLLPLTEMNKTRTIWLETKPGEKDFYPVNLNYGDLFYFNGNKCTHYNEKNIEGKMRLSLDFRVITISDYLKYCQNDIVITKPRDPEKIRDPKKMIMGGYYQLKSKNQKLTDMMIWDDYKNVIIQSRPYFDKKEADACYKYMLEDSFVTEHKKTRELEKMISNFIGCKHTIMTTSGTSAIIMGLMALNLEKDSEVLVPNLTMIATVNSIKFLGLVPILIDIDTETLTISKQEIEKNINEKTKAVIHVSLNNRYKDLEEIVNLCNSRNIVLIEDSAQSLGCRVKGKSLGTFGKLGCFSLSTPKIISSGQGGFIVTDDDNLAKKLGMIKNFGRKESGKDNFEIFGVNFKYTDIQAVICIEQMKKLEDRIKRMKEIYELYYENLKDIYQMKKPLSEEWIPWFVDIYIEDRDKVIDFLRKHNIDSRPIYEAINKTNMYSTNTNLKTSEEASKKGLFLPTHILLKDEEIIFICKVLKLLRLN